MKQDRALSGDVPMERNRARLILGAGADFPKTFTRKRLIRVPSGNSESSAGVELEKKTAESLGVLRGSCQLGSTMANRRPCPECCGKRERRILSVSQKTTGSWGESDRGGIRLWEKVYKDWGLWKRYSVGID